MAEARNKAQCAAQSPWWHTTVSALGIPIVAALHATSPGSRLKWCSQPEIHMLILHRGIVSTFDSPPYSWGLSRYIESVPAHYLSNLPARAASGVRLYQGAQSGCPTVRTLIAGFAVQTRQRWSGKEPGLAKLVSPKRQRHATGVPCS